MKSSGGNSLQDKDGLKIPVYGLSEGRSAMGRNREHSTREYSQPGHHVWNLTDMERQVVRDQ